MRRLIGPVSWSHFFLEGVKLALLALLTGVGTVTRLAYVVTHLLCAPYC